MTLFVAACIAIVLIVVGAYAWARRVIAEDDEPMEHAPHDDRWGGGDW